MAPYVWPPPKCNIGALGIIFFAPGHPISPFFSISELMDFQSSTIMGFTQSKRPAVIVTKTPTRECRLVFRLRDPQTIERRIWCKGIGSIIDGRPSPIVVYQRPQWLYLQRRGGGGVFPRLGSSATDSHVLTTSSGRTSLTQSVGIVRVRVVAVVLFARYCRRGERDRGWELLSGGQVGSAHPDYGNPRCAVCVTFLQPSPPNPRADLCKVLR